MKKIIPTILIGLMILGSTIFLYPQKTSSAGWLEGFGYRKSHEILSLANTGTNYQVKVIVYYTDSTDSGGNVFMASTTQADFDDIRFTASDQTTELDYWRETYTASTSATFWVEVSDDLTSATSTIYIYYSSSTAVSKSNGTNTFLFFDDFSGDLSKWTRHSTSGVYPQISGGVDQQGGGSTSGPGYGWTCLSSGYGYTAFQNYVAIEGKAYFNANSIAEISFRGVTTTNAGYKFRMDARAGANGESWLNNPYSGWGFLGGAGCGSNSSIPATGSWLDFYIRIATSSFRGKVGATTESTCTDTSITAAGEISLQNHYGTETDYDDIRVRKWAVVEPTQGIWGGVEGAPAGNTAPTIDTVTDTPDPQTLNATTTFSVSWTDEDAEGVKMLICTTNAITTSTPACTVSEWCSNKGSFSTTTPLTCDYSTSTAGTWDYYAFVCDDEIECSTSTSGTFTFYFMQINFIRINLGNLKISNGRMIIK